MSENQICDGTDDQVRRLVDERDRMKATVAELRRKLSSTETTLKNADCHLGQEMARRQAAEKERDALEATVVSLRFMYDAVSAHAHELVIERDELAGELNTLKAAKGAQPDITVRGPAQIGDGNTQGNTW